MFRICVRIPSRADGHDGDGNEDGDGDGVGAGDGDGDGIESALSSSWLRQHQHQSFHTLRVFRQLKASCRRLYSARSMVVSSMPQCGSLKLAPSQAGSQVSSQAGTQMPAGGLKCQWAVKWTRGNSVFSIGITVETPCSNNRYSSISGRQP